MLSLPSLLVSLFFGLCVFSSSPCIGTWHTVTTYSYTTDFADTSMISNVPYFPHTVDLSGDEEGVRSANPFSNSQQKSDFLLDLDLSLIFCVVQMCQEASVGGDPSQTTK